MELIQAVIALIGLGAYMEAHHLNKNNIRHDERIWYFISAACLVGLLITFLIK